jgi:hypothetical protein
MIYTSRPRSLQSAKQFASNLNANRVVGSALRHIAVVVHAQSTGFHVVSLGFASAEGFAVVR